MISLIIFIFILLIIILYWCLTKNKELYTNYAAKGKYFLATLSIAKNESMVIKEFIDHYKFQGVSHMFIIDNGSDDNMVEIIKPYVDQGFVTLYNFPEPYKQDQHYNKVYNEIKNKCEWLAVIDIDEYIFGVEDSIEELLKDDPEFSGVDYIILPWIMFGSNGYIKQPKSIRKSFLKRKTLEECKSNPRFDNQKSLFRPSKVGKLNLHLHDIIDKDNTVVIEAPLNKMRLNHYAIMSWEYFSKVKMTRGSATNPEGNKIRDKTYFDIYDADTDTYDTALNDIYIYTNPSIENFYTLAEPVVIFQNNESPTLLDIAVAYYSISLDWLFEILDMFPRESYRLFVYAKNNVEKLEKYKQYLHKLIKLKNIGRCDHTYLYHIIDNYNNKLSKTTLFIKDSGLRHDNDLNSINSTTREWIIKNIEKNILEQGNKNIIFEAIYTRYKEPLYNWVMDKYIQNHDQNFNRDPFITAPKFLRPIQNWAKNILDDENFDISKIEWVAYYGIFFFHSENIKLRPLKTWVRAGVSLSLGPNLEIGHYMERFWLYLLSSGKNFTNFNQITSYNR